MTIRCPHPDAQETRQICEHLLPLIGAERDDSRGNYAWLTGKGIELAIICGQCAVNLPVTPLLIPVCSDCFNQIEKVRPIRAYYGQPEILERPSNLHFVSEAKSLTGDYPGTIIDLKPVIADPHHWIGITNQGAILRLNSESGQVETIMLLSEADWSPIADIGEGYVYPQTQPNVEGKFTGGKKMKLPPDGLVKIHLSHDGRFTAVVNNEGSFGRVYNLSSRQVTMLLDRKDYHQVEQNFSAVFFQHEGRSLLVHATDWNRVDVSDPETGELLTVRESPYKYGVDDPNYLDYFHGSLTVSPDQTWIADFGWVWHPWGAVRGWNLRTWLTQNVWESESGESVRWIGGSGEAWDLPLCWLDEHQIIIQDLDRDEYWISGATVYNLKTEERIREFIGPKGEFVVDKYLFSFNPKDGISVWDIHTGERLHHDPALSPTAYHPIAQVFITLLPDGKIRLSHLVGADSAIH